MTESDSKPLVVSFHTGREPYASYAAALAESCRQIGLDVHIARRPDRGSWVENVALKGPFMRSCMERFRRPLLWIDVDGRVVQAPEALYGAEEDFAIHAVTRNWNWRPVGRSLMALPESWPRELGPKWFLTGTVFVNRTPGGRELLERWAQRSQARPRDYQQLLLQEVWCGLNHLRTRWLPQGYCKINGFRWREGETEDVVIAHDLASGQLATCVRE